MSDREHEEQKVKVTDRRRFVLDESGDIVERPDAPQRARAAVPGGEQASGTEQPAAPSAPNPEAQQAPARQPHEAPSQSTEQSDQTQDEPSQEDQLATQIFLDFLNSLAHSVLIHLGETPDPGSGLVRENLEAAQQTLEVLGVLRKKTQGNLTQQEARMFDQLVYELMMRLRQKLENKQNVPPPGGPQNG